MTVVSQLTGIIPTVVAGGAALKFTKAALGSPKGRKGKRKSKNNSPF